MRITIAGAGVIGLTVAARLARDGHQVRIRTAAAPQDTTSAVAAAIWYPYRAYPQADVTRWSAWTYRELSELATHTGTGVAMRSGREIFRDVRPEPWWKGAVPDFQREVDLPEGYADGFRLTVPVIDMSVHLSWLTAQVAAAGVRLELAPLTDLDDVDGDLVVNCTGLGARALLGDDSMLPIRGQVVIVEQFGLSEWTLDDTDEVNLTYIVPRERTVVLGGTAIDGPTSEDTVPDPDTAAAIVARCAALVPEAGQAPVIGHKVGLRPGRPAVRLERETSRSGRPVIHCYGHGGAGVTLAQGCAEDVAALVTA